MQTRTRVGMVGLGLMGLPMAHNVLKAGYPLTVWNRTSSKEQTLIAAGAQSAISPADVAEQSDVIITIVSDTPDVEAVILGENGVRQGASKGKIVIDMSTISPSATKTIAATLAADGIEMLDAPVSGGTEGAERGTLAIMVGGKPDIFKRCEPILATMGQSITHVGDHGDGQTTKLVNQILVVINMLAVSEALIFGAKAGLDLRKALGAVESGAAGSWMLSNRGPQVLDGDFRPGFMISLQQKDLRLALEAADELQLPMLGTSIVNQLYNTLAARGLESEGNHGLILALEALAGVDARA